MKERLLHILDQSTCLTRRQMKDYLAGTMLPEEVHAAETHISSCPLCSMALEGFQEHTEEALAAISSLNSGFLKDHFDSISPQIHLNSLAPAIPVAHHGQATHKKKGNLIPLYKLGAVAAAILVGFGIFWMIGSRDNIEHTGMIAQNEPATAQSVEKPQPATNVSQAAKMAESSQVTVPVGDSKMELRKQSAYSPEQPATGKAVAADRIAANAAKPEAASATEDQAFSMSSGAAAPSAPPAATKPVARTMTKDRSVMMTDSVAPDKTKAKQAAKMLAVRETEDEKKVAERSRAEESVDEDADHLQLGNEAYSSKNYQSALNHYKAQMNTGRPKRRAEATFRAAECYKNLGNRTKAVSLLKGLVENDGPYRKSARKLLDEMGVK